MQGHRERMDLLERLIGDGVARGVGGCHAEDARSDGRQVRIRGRDLVNFASCSYLGLELDPRLIEGAIAAVRAHGIETSSSRVYLSSPLYTELEAHLREIFQAHVVITPTTTLGHLSALPALVDERDAIVMDHQVHSSVQMACQFVATTGARLEFVPHNDLEALEARVVELSERHYRVWYMADGVYSMFGDLAPIRELVAMLDRHESMRLYVDDAHGMSWCGPRGAGTVLDAVSLHPRMVLITGLAKGFGTGGGVVVLPDEAQRHRVRTCGPTLIFAGPIQPPILGAAIESAKIHLSPEIGTLQAELRARMDLCNRLFAERRVPVISSPETPVGFVGTGPTRASQGLVECMMEEGLFTNPAQFPAAPMRRSGLRFLLTRHHTARDIESLVEAVDRHWERAVREAGSTPEEVWQAFGLEPPQAPQRRVGPERAAALHLEVANSIEKLDASEWDARMEGRGCLGSRAVRVFEQAFGPEASPENRWDFRYYVVRDESGEPVLATCFTRALWKADMLAPTAVSDAVEARRAEDPLYLTQRVFGMGCLLSEGDQLWLREPAESATSRDAITLLLEAVRADARVLGCDVRVIRDVPASAAGLGRILEQDGLMAMPAPESFVLEPVPASDEDLVQRLGRDHRRHWRREVLPWNDAYEIEVVDAEGRALADGESDRLYSLYENVKRRNLELNTFALPKALIPVLAGAPGWELVLMRVAGEPERPPVGFIASHVTRETYVPLFSGLDYEHVRQSGLYRQVLRHAVHRARDLGCRRVRFGFGAGLEKRRMGARPEAASIYLEADDHFAFDALAQLASETAGADA